MFVDILPTHEGESAFVHIFGTLLQFFTAVRGREDWLSRGRWGAVKNVSKEVPHSLRRIARVCLPSFSRFKALFKAAIVSAISVCCEGIAVALAGDLTQEGDVRSSARRK